MLTPEQQAFVAEVEAFKNDVREATEEFRALRRRVGEQERRFKKIEKVIRDIAINRGIA